MQRVSRQPRHHLLRNHLFQLNFLAIAGGIWTDLEWTVAIKGTTLIPRRTREMMKFVKVWIGTVIRRRNVTEEPQLDSETIDVLEQVAKAARTRPGRKIEDAWADFESRKQALRDAADKPTSGLRF
ncbi:hypothetical protein JL39_25725 [Rhizobium sp. YS-1r]|nr:hypothetical protein JL39_25725 [Rhizobium sp. YS-1r]